MEDRVARRKEPPLGGIDDPAVSMRRNVYCSATTQLHRHAGVTVITPLIDTCKHFQSLSSLLMSMWPPLHVWPTFRSVPSLAILYVQHVSVRVSWI